MNMPFLKSLNTWKLISNSLSSGHAAILLYVVNSIGSSPGRAGFCMAVTASGATEGSLGGGIMEHKFIELAKSRLLAGDVQISLHHQVHNKTVAGNQSGMICSGEQTIVLYPVRQKELSTINSIIDMLENNRNATLTISPEGLGGRPVSNFVPPAFDVTDTLSWSYTETLGYVHRLYIIGGGHCALALSKIMCMMDFYIEIYEDRTDLKTLAVNNYVHQKHLVDDYSSLTESVREGEHTFVVIMTVGYRSDGIALRALIGKKFRYIGVLGSRAKIEKMISDLREDGYPESIIGRLHAPVGLPIQSETPEEVAISIAAEIIKVKNE